LSGFLLRNVDMNYILFDDDARYQLLPFTHTRPVADIRCGILTMRQRWEQLLQQPTGTLTEAYLQEVFPLNSGADNVYINGSVFGNSELIAAIHALRPEQKLVKGDVVIAARIKGDGITLPGINTIPSQNYDGDVPAIRNVWDIFSLNDMAIRADFDLITKGRTGAPIPGDIMVSGKEQIFIEEGANVYTGCIINATKGPVYIGKAAEVLEGVMIRGPLAVGEHAVIKMGAKIYGATTIGPGCKVGGEISNTVFFANSNKSHDGYVGNAVIGEWCNLGADTNASNLKNNYDEINIWSEYENKLVPTGIIFCGLMMGDHSKCGINTMFNTATVVGVSCNIFGGDFPQKFVNSFSWGSSRKMLAYDFNKSMDTANRMMGRRGLQLSEKEIAMYRYIYDNSGKGR
jgi:UDP-N-acetylglucosamine diphosphorylase/glucosamine-1-phosphate N-acetyltransferase